MGMIDHSTRSKESRDFLFGMSHHIILKEPGFFLMGINHFLMGMALFAWEWGAFEWERVALKLRTNGKVPPPHSEGIQVPLMGMRVSNHFRIGLSHDCILKETHYFPTGMNHHCILKKPIYFLIRLGHLLIKRDGSLINGKEPPRHSQRK